MASQFPPITHHITTNSPTGSSSFHNTTNPPPSQSFSPSIRMHYIYSTPPSLTTTSNADLTQHLTHLPASPHSSSPPLPSFPPAGGSAFCVLEIAPNASGEEGFLHRTKTIDYVYMMDGELELSLDGGEKKVVRKGEFLVQRASMHSWKNLSASQGARMLVVSLGSEGAVEGEMEFPQ